MIRKLNLNLSEVVSRFESLMKKRLLIKTVFYKRIFGGKGFEFDSFRLYSPELDDAQLIDWKATMKNPERILIRQYVEERDLKIFFIVDVGDNMVFGSGNKLKSEVAGEVLSCLSHTVLSSGDSVGFALYSKNIIKMQMPSSGMQSYHNMIKIIENPANYGGKSDLKTALRFILPNLKKISAIFIISDFINVDEGAMKLLKTFMAGKETVGVMIKDPVDTELPNLKNEVIVEDIYTGEQRVINPAIIKEEYKKNTLEQERKIFNLFRETGSDIIKIETDKDFLMPLADFLRGRVKRRKFHQE